MAFTRYSQWRFSSLFMATPALCVFAIFKASSIIAESLHMTNVPNALERTAANAMNEGSNRHQVMSDSLFWWRLAIGAGGWLEGSGDSSLRRFWIDDFLPESATDTKLGVDIEGTAWVGEGSRVQHPYRFVVSIPQKMLHRRERGFSIEHLVLDEAQRILQIQIVSERQVT
jgi:hypothetical protein